jgi:hemoglobin
MYPDDDMPGARERLALFLIQYFGGPAIYSEQHGHPRLRMRHAPYKVDTKAADAWLSHMDKALETTPAFAPYVDGMKAYFHHTAYFLRNTGDAQ